MAPLAFLLHHANKSTKDLAFYRIKDMLLKKHAVSIGYDVQHIAGKRCHSCGGSGIFVHYSGDRDDCYRCIGGWWKLPQWIALEKFRWECYTFHRPMKREFCVSNPFAKESLGWEVGPVIEGYIDHHEAKYSYLAVYILFVIYDRKAFAMRFARWWRQLGIGWFHFWWLPRHWLNNLVYLWRHRNTPKYINEPYTEEELPF